MQDLLKKLEEGNNKLDQFINDVKLVEKKRRDDAVELVEKVMRLSERINKTKETLAGLKAAEYEGWEAMVEEGQKLIDSDVSLRTELISLPLYQLGAQVVEDRKKPAPASSPKPKAKAKKKPSVTTEQHEAAVAAYRELVKKGIKQKDEVKTDFVYDENGKAVYDFTNDRWMKKTIIVTEGEWMPLYKVVSIRAAHWLRKDRGKLSQAEYLKKRNMSFKGHLMYVAGKVLAQNGINPEHLGKEHLLKIADSVIDARKIYRNNKKRLAECNGDEFAATEGESVPLEGPGIKDPELLEAFENNARDERFKN